ncbi:MAG: glycosyltransferase family 87 protein [Pyrinomonadaceae bacterium]
MTNIWDHLEASFNGSRRVRSMLAAVVAVIGVLAISIAIKKALTRELDVFVILNASRDLLNGADIYASPAPNGAYYLYLPLLAFIFIPLTLVPQAVAGALWTLLCITLIWWCLHESIKLVAGDAYGELKSFHVWGLHLLPVILCADAISSEVGNAQLNCLILGAGILGLKLTGARRYVAGGAVIGIAAVAKVFTAPILLYELLNRRFRTGIGSVIAGAIGLLLPATIIGWQRNIGYVDYWTKNIALHQDLTTHPSGFAGNASLQAVLTRLLTDEPAFVWQGSAYRMNLASLDPAAISTLGIFVPVLAVLLLVLYFAIFHGRRELISYWGGIALAFCVAPLITPVVERPHFLMLLPAYVYVCWLGLYEGLKRRWFYLLLAGAWVLSTFTLKLYVGDFWGNVFWALGAPMLADLCLIAAIFLAASGEDIPELTPER